MIQKVCQFVPAEMSVSPRLKRLRQNIMEIEVPI